MKYFIYSILIFSLYFCFFQPKASLADAFVVNLKYTAATQELYFNSAPVTHDHNLSIPISESINNPTSGQYKIIFFDKTGSEIIAQYFDPQEGDFSISLPYFSIAKGVEIQKASTGEKILEADLSSFISCNNNGQCEFGKGENIYTCLSDCAAGTVKYDQETTKLLNKNNGIIKDPATGKILLRQLTNANANKNSNPVYVIFIVIAIIIAIIAFILLRRRQK